MAGARLTGTSKSLSLSSRDSWRAAPAREEEPSEGRQQEGTGRCQNPRRELRTLAAGGEGDVTAVPGGGQELARTRGTRPPGAGTARAEVWRPAERVRAACTDSTGTQGVGRQGRRAGAARRPSQGTKEVLGLINRRRLGRVFSPGSMRTDVRCDTEPMAWGAPTGGGQTRGVPAPGETQVTAAPALGHEA